MSSDNGGGILQEKITVISVNFKTPDLIRTCVSSLRQFYPSVPYILLDNGGCVTSLVTIRDLGKKFSVLTVENEKNIGHGPGLHQGIKLASTPYVFLLDSDTRVKKGGFLEKMLALFEDDPKLLAAGWLRYVNASGVAGPKQELKRGMPYVHPYACFLDREKYFKCLPFIHSGAPATKLMNSARKKGYSLVSFPVEEYVWHKVAGTRGCFGGECRVPTHWKKKKWRKHRI